MLRLRENSLVVSLQKWSALSVAIHVAILPELVEEVGGETLDTREGHALVVDLVQNGLFTVSAIRAEPPLGVRYLRDQNAEQIQSSLLWAISQPLQVLLLILVEGESLQVILRHFFLL